VADPRFTGTTDDGQVRAVVDHAGRLVELVLEPALLRRPVWVVSEEIRTAIARAQTPAFPVAEADSPLDLNRLGEQVEAIELEADRRMAELRMIVADLARPRENHR
jgi:hypothetical protein